MDGPKFRDIPQLTDEGHYQVDVSLDYIIPLITHYQEQYGLDLDVDFQRAHVWTQEQQVAFVEHILRGGHGSNLIRFNRAHWGAHRDVSIDGPMVLVDGKQRLTAVIKFLKGEIPVFGHYIGEYQDQPRLKYGLKFQINDLRTRAAVLRWYLEINTGGTPHTDEEIEKVQRMLSEVTDGE